MTVVSVTLPAMRGLNPGDFIHVTFDRGSKTVSCAEHELSVFEDELSVTEIKESLSLPVTLYKDSHGEFQVIFAT